MEKEKRRQLLKKVLDEAERGTVTRLADHFETNTGLIYQWQKKEGPWPPFKKERKVWLFLGYELTDQKEVLPLKEASNQPSPPEPKLEKIKFNDYETGQLLEMIGQASEILRRRVTEEPSSRGREK